MRLGLDPDELGSPWSAALSSLGAFAAGAVVVVLPYGFSSALIAAIVLASLALFAVGGDRCAQRPRPPAIGDATVAEW